MIRFETLFKNHFNSPRISFNELKTFSEDHLARITTNNPAHILDPIVAPTGSAHTAYFGALSNKDVALAVQQALTVNVDNKLQAFKTAVSRNAGTIQSAFGKDGAEYQEFFPHGLSEYGNALKENVEVLMTRIVAASTAYAAQLPDGFAAIFSTLRTEYQAARAAQLGKKGVVAENSDTARALRTELELQLVANIHFIGYKYPGNVSQCAAYFDQSILNEDDSGDGGPTDYIGTVAGGETKTIATLRYDADGNVTMKNTGSTGLTISLNVTAGTPQGNPVVLAAGADMTKTMSELNASTLATLLQVKNMDGAEAGAYAVTLA